MTEEVIDFNAEEETTFGAHAGKKQNKKTQAQAVQKAADKKRVVVVKKPEGQEEKKAKAPTAIKDVVVIADENCVPVDETR